VDISLTMTRLASTPLFSPFRPKRRPVRPIMRIRVKETMS
jgi:hypothetical protein